MTPGQQRSFALALMIAALAIASCGGGSERPQEIDAGLWVELWEESGEVGPRPPWPLTEERVDLHCTVVDDGEVRVIAPFLVTGDGRQYAIFGHLDYGIPDMRDVADIGVTRLPDGSKNLLLNRGLRFLREQTFSLCVELRGALPR